MSVFVKEEHENVPRVRSRKKYETKYSLKYEVDYPWVMSSPKGEKYALCRICQIDICIKSVGAKGLRDHEVTGRHIQKSSEKNVQVFPSLPQPPPSQPPSSAAPLHGAMYPVLEVEGGGDQESDDILGLPRPLTPQTPNTPLSPSEELVKPSSSTIILDNPRSSHSPVKTEVSLVKISSNIKSEKESILIEYDSPNSFDRTNSSPAKSIVKQNTSKKEAERMFSESTDDLTCNVCEQVFEVWTELKKHLLDHIITVVQGRNKNCGRGRGRQSNSKKSSKSHTSIIHESADVKKRGRPPGSRNKVSGNMVPTVSQQGGKRPVRQRSNPSYSTFNEEDLDDPTPVSDSEINTESSQMDVGRVEDQEDVSEDYIGDAVFDSSLQEETDDGSKKKNDVRQCRVCKTFYSREELKEHQRTEHNNNRPYHCTDCDKFFTTKNHLEVHIKHKHSSGPNPCQCDVCGKVLSSRTNLRIHTRIHVGDKPFKCPICEKSFTRKANMEMHQVYHTGEKKFTCEVCGQSFFAINALKRHSKLHTGERDFACEICGATYVTRTDLRRHKLKHDDVKPFPCQVCSKQFTRSHDLKVHMRYHNKELRYTCDVCLKQFVESGNYKRHMRRHTGERPYSCGCCYQTFSQVHHLKAHMKNSHLTEHINIETAQNAPRRMSHRNPRTSVKRITKSRMQQPSAIPNLTQSLLHTHSSSHPHGITSGSEGITLNTAQTTAPPIAHQGTVVSTTGRTTHTTQIPASGAVNSSSAIPNFLPQYNPTLYNHAVNHAVMPHYPTLFDMCPQQNCSNPLNSH